VGVYEDLTGETEKVLPRFPGLPAPSPTALARTRRVLIITDVSGTPAPCQ